MQLLIKLGLVPDPEAKKEIEEFDPHMSMDQRESKLKEVGLFIPKKNMDQLQKEMEQIAIDNYNKMIEENEKKLSKEELNTLKKLGMTNEQIAELDPDDNPFKDFGMSGRQDLTQLVQAY